MSESYQKMITSFEEHLSNEKQKINVRKDYHSIVADLKSMHQDESGLIQGFDLYTYHKLQQIYDYIEKVRGWVVSGYIFRCLIIFLYLGKIKI